MRVSTGLQMEKKHFFKLAKIYANTNYIESKNALIAS